jgi:hypothetical protein
MKELQPFELEALKHEDRLTKAICGAMICLKMVEWAKTEEGIEKLQQWFEKHPYHYDTTHVQPPEEDTE